jgi:hypothetical protein
MSTVHPLPVMFAQPENTTDAANTAKAIDFFIFSLPRVS